MKTIDKVKVFSFYSLYEDFLKMKNEEDSEAIVTEFENELKAKGFVWDDNQDYIVGYEIEQIFNEKAPSYIEAIEYWREGDEVKITSFLNKYSSISVSWEHVYEELKEHVNYTDTYFKPEEVEKLVIGEISLEAYTNNIVNQFAIDYIKAFTLQDIIDKANCMTAENLEWE